MIISRSPLRVTLGGGGTDLPSYYKKNGGFAHPLPHCASGGRAHPHLFTHLQHERRD